MLSAKGDRSQGSAPGKPRRKARTQPVEKTVCLIQLDLSQIGPYEVIQPEIHPRPPRSKRLREINRIVLEEYIASIKGKH